MAIIFNKQSANKVQASPNDTTPKTLTEKLVQGTNITLTENNDGADETITIDASGGGSSLTIEDNGTPLSTNASKLNFTNFTIAEPVADEFDITAPSGGGGGGTGETLVLTGDIDLTSSNAQNILLDPGGADRSVRLPDATEGGLISIRVIGESTNEITLRTSGTDGSILVTLMREQTGEVFKVEGQSDANEWYLNGYVVDALVFNPGFVAGAPPTIMASAFFHVNGENTVNDGTTVQSLNNLGTGPQTIVASGVNNEPLFIASGLNGLPGYEAVDTGSDATRDSFDISPSFSTPNTGWSFIYAGRIDTGTQLLSNRVNSNQIRIPNGGAMTVNDGVNRNSGTLVNTHPFTYVYAVIWTGSLYEFYEGLTALGTSAGSGVVDIDAIGEIQSNIRRNDALSGTTIYWDSIITTQEREDVTNYLATLYGITL